MYMSRNEYDSSQLPLLLICFAWTALQTPAPMKPVRDKFTLVLYYCLGLRNLSCEHYHSAALGLGILHDKRWGGGVVRSHNEKKIRELEKHEIATKIKWNKQKIEEDSKEVEEDENRRERRRMRLVAKSSVPVANVPRELSELVQVRERI